MLNIDIRKAFDSISWTFLEKMLKGLGFSEMFIKWTMSCISTPKFSVSLNESLHGYFKGARGLRQGASASKKASKLKNILHSSDLPEILESSEDSNRGDLYSVQKLYHCVRDFGAITGLEANPSKCVIFFGGVDDHIKSSINSCLGFQEGTLPIKYLGVHLICKRLSYIDCFPLFRKITSQFQTWLKFQKLSYARRLQVIKSVILGVQLYRTSNYILPAKVLHKIDVLCRDFLWGKTDQVFKTPLVAWEKICKEKKYGGLGIFSTATWNIASGLKLIWYIHINKEWLWIKWIHANYLKNSTIWQVNMKSSDSWMWKQLLLKNSTIWQVNMKSSDSWMWKQLLKVRDKEIIICGGIDNLKQYCKAKIDYLGEALFNLDNVAYALQLRNLVAIFSLNVTSHVVYGITSWIGFNSDGRLVTRDVKEAILITTLNGSFSEDNKQWIMSL
ncbi:uncharacterized protein LOC109826514 [Asparagus officinalis]|uniref:uncharacterized protein LOC109826514 n=1 Tax=Asparagus officinalis TaxID=4686 RepID=UPI00098E6CA7|nr:uncharacterized protein LOC109826514 [Asparagus officinalis]